MAPIFAGVVYRLERWARTASPVRNSLEEFSLIRRFMRDDGGATAIEYGLIAAGISVAIIAIVNTLGANLNTTFTSISSQLK